MLISYLVIDTRTSLLNLKNASGNMESNAVVALDIGRNPTTYKVLSYYADQIRKQTHTLIYGGIFWRFILVVELLLHCSGSNTN